MLKKGILLSAVLMLLGCTVAEARRDIVVPTPYGYGVVSAHALARPYITGYYPYAWPGQGYSGVYPVTAMPAAYGYSGMYPTAPMPTALGTPAWNGSYWSYGSYGAYGTQNASANGSLVAVTSNLNIRSAPYVTGRKSRNPNVIGSLNAGEHVYILGQTGNWSYVQSASMPLRRGYVYTSYLRAYNNSLPQGNFAPILPQNQQMAYGYSW